MIDHEDLMQTLHIIWVLEKEEREKEREKRRRKGRVALCPVLIHITQRMETQIHILMNVHRMWL